MSSSATAVVNVTRFIDDGLVSRLQVTAIILCSLIAFLDGLDSQSIAVAAPIIVDNLRLTRATLGPIFSIGLFGAMIGALTFGPLGDKFGRKRMLVFATTIFGICTLATAYANAYTSLLVIRFAAGLGLGGATPCFIALASEYAPLRRRAMVASLIWAAFPLGVSAGGFLNAAILEHFGWQAIFLIGGILPLVVVVLLSLWLPESIRYLLATSADHARIGSIVARIRPATPANARYIADEERAQGAPLLHLFTEGRAARTLLLWVPFFTGFGTLAITVVWTPVLLRDHGIPLSQASFVLGVHGIGALIGMASAGRLIERFGAVALLFPSFAFGAVVVGAMGYAAVSVPTMATALFLVGLFVGSGGSGSIALATLIYPTAIRSTGVGWAMGMGRFGQVLTPLFATVLTAGGYSERQLFLVLSMLPILGALAVLAFRQRPAAAAQPI